MSVGRRQSCCLVVLILSLAVGSVALAAETAFADTDDAEGAFSTLRLPPGHPYRFDADPARSQIVVTAEVMGIEKYDTSPVSGWLDVTLAAGQAPFSTIHITDLDLQLTEQIDLSYGLLGWATGTGIGVSMSAPGSAAAVQNDDSFLQTGNYLAGRGIFSYKFLGQTGSVDLSTMDPVASDLSGFVWQDWTTITLQMDIAIEYPLELDGTPIGTAWIEGTIVATTQVFWAIADLYSDGFVNFRDFAVFAPAWGTSLGNPGYSDECELDQPADGFIDAADLAVFADRWLTGVE